MSDEPSQLPPQVATVLVHGARVPRGAPATRVQVPTLPVSLQAWHWPVQAAEQHTPSAQKSEAHSSLLVHFSPAFFLARHTPVLLQYMSAPQFPPVQLSEHLLPSPEQRLLGQVFVAGVVQAPWPSHTDAAVALPSLQLAAVQIPVAPG